jgi:dTMP kinase
MADQAPTVPFSDRPSGLGGLLSKRYFRRLWMVTGVSSLGDWLAVFALTAYVAELSGRPEFAVGGVLLFRVVPGMFFGPFAGVLADRFDRRRLMVFADLMRALLVCIIPFVKDLLVLYAISALLELLSLMWTPSKDATLPNLVHRDQLLQANQLNLITTYATLPLGGALVALLAVPAAMLARAGGIFASLEQQPVQLAFFIDALTFLFSAMMIARFPKQLMVAPSASRAAGEPFRPFRDLMEGLRFVRTHPIVRSLILGAWVAFTGGSAVVSLGPILANKLTFGGTAAAQAAWGALIVAVGVGLVSGMLLAGVLGKVFKRETIFPLGLISSGVMTIVVATRSSFAPALVATVFCGFGAGLAWVTTFALLQERVDERLRGRTFATLYTGIQLSLFAGLAGWPLLSGALGDRSITVGSTIVDLSGARISIVLGGTILSFAGILAARVGSSRAAQRAARRGGLRLSFGQGGAQRSGLFIAFEGVEGAGKSTQMQRLAEWLITDRDRDVVVTREPGGTVLADRIRSVVLEPGHGQIDGKTEALLFAASRAQHVAERIRPALESGKVVLCDRYIDSSLAYQGVARGLGEQDVLHLNIWATDELMPDLVILLHLDPDEGLSRKGGRLDRMEQESLDFHTSVSEAYLRLARQYPSRFALVDASVDIETVQSQIRTAILPLLQPLEVSGP